MAPFFDFDTTFILLFFLSNPPLSPLLALSLISLLLLLLTPGGLAWALTLTQRRPRFIPGPPGVILALSSTSAHRSLAKLSRSLNAIPLMAFSVGLTRFIVSSHPDTAKHILNSPAFADRPIKESAYGLLFHRAMGFAPHGEYWRRLRRVSATYLFSPRMVAATGEQRRGIGEGMVEEVKGMMVRDGEVPVRTVMHSGSLDSVMESVFGRRSDSEVEEMVREGYELLGLFNWGDHLPVIGWLDLQGVRRRCRSLVGRVNVFVGRIIDEHRRRRRAVCSASGGGVGDFVDVLLDLEEEERLSDSDMIAVLWV